MHHKARRTAKPHDAGTADALTEKKAKAATKAKTATKAKAATTTKKSAAKK